jgi:PAS domain S-box-containing protein
MSGCSKGIGDKRSGTALRGSGEHYRAVAEATTDAIITINSESTILLVNPAAEKIFGYLTEEMVGRQLTMLMPKYQRHLHRAGMARYLKSGQRHLEWGAVQLPGLHKSGLEIELEISFLEFIRDGQHFFTGIVRNVSEQKRHRYSEDIGDNQALFSAIINQTIVGISVVNMEGHFTFVNERYCQIVGRTREELLKATMSDITYADDLPATLAKFERAKDFGESFEIEKRYLRLDGTCVWVHNYESVLQDAAGKPFVVMAITLDITERKRMEESAPVSRTGSARKTAAS